MNCRRSTIRNLFPGGSALLRKGIFIALLLILLTVSLIVCGVELTCSVIREYEQNRYGVEQKEEISRSLHFHGGDGDAGM